MGIHFKIETKKCVIFATCEGEVELSDFKNLRRDYSTHPNYQPGFDLLIDARAASFKMTGEGARTLANLRVENPLTKRLVIVGETSFGFIRMFQGWTGNDPKTQVFKDMKSAMEWLGLPVEEK